MGTGGVCSGWRAPAAAGGADAQAPEDGAKAFTLLGVHAAEGHHGARRDPRPDCDSAGAQSAPLPQGDHLIAIAALTTHPTQKSPGSTCLVDGGAAAGHEVEVSPSDSASQKMGGA